jgi:purine-binding chemotaxis protein CheW
VQLLEADTQYATPAAILESATRRAVIVVAGGTTLALSLEGCREIVEGAQCTPLPGSEPFVRGLINLRGRLVTVIDLGAWLGGGASARAPQHATLMLEWAGRLVGVTVDDVVRIAVLESDRISAMAEPAGAIELFRCVDDEDGPAENSVVGVLNVDRIFGAIIL